MGAMVHAESLGEERQLQRGEYGGRGARQEEMKRASSHLAGETSAVHPKWFWFLRSPRPPRFNCFFWAHMFRLKAGLRTRNVTTTVWRNLSTAAGTCVFFSHGLESIQ